MKSTLHRTLALIAAAGLAASLWAALPALAQGTAADAQKMQAARERIRADRKAVVLRNMQLTEAEAAKFTPVYEAYEKELNEVNRKLTKVVVDYVNMGSTLTNGQAKQLTSQLFAHEAAESKLVRTYYDKVRKALSEVKAARFLQIENKIRAIARYDIAAAIPLVD